MKKQNLELKFHTNRKEQFYVLIPTEKFKI